MKKSKILLVAIIAVVILTLTLVAVMCVGFKDEITDTNEKKINDRNTLIQYEMKSGAEIEIPIEMSYTEISDGQYEIEVFFSRRECKNYEVENLKTKLMISDELEIISKRCEFGSGNTDGSEITENNGVKMLQYETESNYIKFNVIVKGDVPENATLNIQYDISGEGLYSFNRFRALEHEYEISFE